MCHGRMVTSRWSTTTSPCTVGGHSPELAKCWHLWSRWNEWLEIRRRLTPSTSLPVLQNLCREDAKGRRVFRAEPRFRVSGISIRFSCLTYSNMCCFENLFVPSRLRGKDFAVLQGRRNQPKSRAFITRKQARNTASCPGRRRL